MKDFFKSVSIALVILILSVLFTDLALGAKVKPQRSPICQELAKDGGEAKRVIDIIRGNRDISRKNELLSLISEYRAILRRMRKEEC